MGKSLKASDVLRWAACGILDVEIIDEALPLFFLLSGKSVRQSWLHKTKVRGRVSRKTKVTYLRKGIFLAPIWLDVGDWEVHELRKREKNLHEEGIFFFDDSWHRLHYMKVNNLDGAIRQQEHMAAWEEQVIIESRFFADDITRKYRILEKIGQRRVSLMGLRSRTITELGNIRNTLQNFVSNAPIFNAPQAADDSSSESRRAMITSIRRRIRKLESERFRFRPVYRRLWYARRSLDIACQLLEANNTEAAKTKIRSAIASLSYPESKPTQPSS